MIDDEQEQVGPRGQVAGLALAGRAPLADLGEARGVGQEDGPVDPFDVVGVVLAVAGRPHHGLGLADVPAEQGVDQRGLARRARAEDDDVERRDLPSALRLDLRELVRQLFSSPDVNDSLDE